MRPAVRQARTVVVTPAAPVAVPAPAALAVAVVQEAVRTARVEAIVPEVDAPVEAVDVAKR